MFAVCLFLCVSSSWCIFVYFLGGVTQTGLAQFRTAQWLSASGFDVYTCLHEDEDRRDGDDAVPRRAAPRENLKYPPSVHVVSTETRSG